MKARLACDVYYVNDSAKEALGHCLTKDELDTHVCKLGAKGDEVFATPDGDWRWEFGEFEKGSKFVEVL